MSKEQKTMLEESDRYISIRIKRDKEVPTLDEVMAYVQSIFGGDLDAEVN